MTVPFIIGEAGVAHNGDVEVALDLVEAARDAGADAVKFQTYRTDKLLRRSDPDYDLLANLELPLIAFKKIAAHAEACGVEFMSTPGDVECLEYLVKECGMKKVKIGSDDLTNKPLVQAACATGLPVLVSTGMATVSQIEDAIPARADITLLHCVSLYPCPPELANLRRIEALRDYFLSPVGYSDHTVGTTACVAATAMGALVIEKHIMLQGTRPVDWQVSVAPLTFKAMVEKVREVAVMLGEGHSGPSAAELEAAKRLRKGADGLRGEA